MFRYLSRAVFVDVALLDLRDFLVFLARYFSARVTNSMVFPYDERASSPQVSNPCFIKTMPRQPGAPSKAAEAAFASKKPGLI